MDNMNMNNTSQNTNSSTNANKTSGGMGGAFKKFGSTLINTFKRPLTTTAEFAENATIMESAVMLGIVAAAYSMLSLFIGATTCIQQSIQYINWWGYSFLLPASTVVGRLVGGLFLPLVYAAMMLGTVLGVYALVNQLFLKKKIDFRKFLAFAGSLGVGLLVCLVLKFVEGFGGVIAGGSVATLNGNFFFVAIRMAAATMVLTLALMNLYKILQDTKQFLITVGIGMASLMLVGFLLDFFFSQLNDCFFGLPTFPFVG